MAKLLGLSLFTLSLFALTGCASLGLGKSEYSCKGYPNGVSCKSAREVYALTEYQEAVITKNDQKDSCPGCQARSQIQNNMQNSLNTTQTLSPEIQAVRKTTYSGPIPIRTPSKIIRIWLAPWEDQDGFLHLGSYLYAEVEPRRWMIGEHVPKISQRLKPLQVDVPRKHSSPPSSSTKMPGFIPKTKN